MKKLFITFLSVTVLLFTLTSVAAGYCEGVADNVVPAVAANDEPPCSSQDVQTHQGHHCGHLSAHAIGQPMAGTFIDYPPERMLTAVSPALHLSFHLDTPIRPPSRLSS